MTTAEEPRSPLIPPAWLQPIIELAADAEGLLISAVTNRLAEGLASDDWAARMAADTAAMRRETDRILTALADRTGTAVTEALTRAYERGRGEPFPDGKEFGLLARILEALRTAWRSVRSALGGRWQRAIAAGTVAPDEQARRLAVQRELDRLADRGVEAFRDARNRPMSLRPYVEQVVTDAAHDAGQTGFTDLLQADGGDLVIVTRSPHPCPICGPWEERVLSVSGQDSRRPSLAEARAAGLFHPRCRHTMFGWKPGFKWPPHSIEHEPGTYEAEQRQRAIERNIRRWKRRKVAALDDTTRLAAGRKVRQWEAALRQHLATEGLKRSRMRERTDFGHSRPLTHAHSA